MAPSSALLADPSLGSVCCDGATTEVLPAVAPFEISYDDSVRREGLYDVPDETL